MSFIDTLLARHKIYCVPKSRAHEADPDAPDTWFVIVRDGDTVEELAAAADACAHGYYASLVLARLLAEADPRERAKLDAGLPKAMFSWVPLSDEQPEEARETACWTFIALFKQKLAEFIHVQPDEIPEHFITAFAGRTEDVLERESGRHSRVEAQEQAQEDGEGVQGGES